MIFFWIKEKEYLNRYDELIGKLVSWAKISDDIKAIFIIGSYARTDHPADEYSDLDLVIVTDNPDYFIMSTQWLKNIGAYWVTFIERTATGEGKERRVLFDNALDVDFVIISQKEFEQIDADNEAQETLKRGFRVLIDKNGLAKTLPQLSVECRVYSPPTENEFVNLVNDFWYHTVWTTKKLQRKELWAAKFCLDNYMKGHLLRVIEWHTHITNGWDCDTWHNGRFLDIWAGQEITKELKNAFSHYNKNDIGCALIVTMNLFRALAIKVAIKMDFEYPYSADRNTTEWVNKFLILC
jgi:aminoglycoside 6-adenylyltransferase